MYDMVWRGLRPQFRREQRHPAHGRHGRTHRPGLLAGLRAAGEPGAARPAPASGCGRRLVLSAGA
eukprot:968055-Heterocapsa_arctica.AAC.1